LSTDRFDLVVLGSGPAGEKGAAQAAYFGKKVAVVERMPEPGGVSVHTGTLPSKTLREAALYLTGFQRRELYGMTLRIDRKKSLRQLAGRLRDVTNRQTRQILRSFERHLIELVHGRARFVDAKTIAVVDADGNETRRLSAEAVLIAVGSSPLPPRGITFEDPDVEDSDRILDLDRIPRTLAVVGGGVIGCEYASIFAALGTKVTLIEGRDRLLGFLDGELSAALKIALERMGTEILLGDAVEKIWREPGLESNALRIQLKSGRVLKDDKVLFSAGRKGNTDGLGLEAAGVTYDEKGRIPVDMHFATNVPGIYAAGDVVGFPSLAATGMEQGRVAACHAFGIPFKTEVANLFPYGIYTVPEISMIGATEEELRAKGTPYEVGRSRYENNARGQITGDPDGFVKLIFDPQSKRLLGAHVIGGGATELVHIPQMVMAKGGGLEEFLDAVFNFPTLSECFKYASYDGLQRLEHRTAALDSAAPAAALAARAMAPAARPWFLGVDLTDPFDSAPRPVVVAAMDRWRRIRFRTWTFDPSGVDIVTAGVAADGYVLAIDGPQGLPADGRRFRASERALRDTVTVDRELPNTLKARPEPPASARLFAGLRAHGLGVLGEAPADETVLLETYPADLFAKWARRRLPKKTTPQGRKARWDVLRGQGLELPIGADAITHDQLDAAAAALCAYLWATGNARELGERPTFDAGRGLLREGLIVSV
jgi:NAD(P) transhydrogenase